jgi:energy-coupling factor transport system ATP-binding protein
LIQIRNLTVRYPRSAAPALRDLSFEIDSGQLVLLLGPSGSGKSTLARTLAGLIPHSVFAQVEGEVVVDGVHPLMAGPAASALRVGLLFQDPEAGFATLTVEDEIAFGLENLRLPRSRMPARIRTALAATGQTDLLRRPLHSLSAGEAQGVALAALLAMEPAVLVLDEPTAHLDPASTREFFARLSRLKRARTILLIEHKLDACLRLADRLVLLDSDGSLLASGGPKQVFARKRKRILATGTWLPRSLEPPARPRTDRGAVPRPVRAAPAVSVRRLTFAYPGGPPVLRRLDLDVPAGAFVALVGPNASGKSTLARLLIGLLPKPGGSTIQLFGSDLEGLTARDMARQVGFVFQNPEHQFLRETVREELAYSLEIRRTTVDQRPREVERLLERFDLRGLEDRNPFTLSQGEKRRLSVAEMLAAGQRLLILDEPTFGQDRKSTYALMDSLADRNREGVTIIVITHDMRFVQRYADTAAVLLGGKIVFQGTPRSLFRRARLARKARLT